MAKYELKTKVNDADVVDFLNSVENERRKVDSLKILDIAPCDGFAYLVRGDHSIIRLP